MPIGIKQVKHQKLAKFCQVILMDMEGNMVNSCDSIFVTEELKQTLVYDWFPFLESIFPVLLSLKKEDGPLRFSKVEEPSEFLPGYYDFSFSKVELEGGHFILWEIYDYTAIYEDFKQYQQKRNELEIQRQILALQNKKLQTKSDVLNRSNLRLGLYDENEEKKKSKILLTPMGAIDWLAKSLSSLSQKNGAEHLDSLYEASKDMDLVIGELMRNTKQDAMPSDRDGAFDFKRVVSEVIEHLHTWMSPRTIHLVIDDVIPRYLKGDVNCFRQIFTGFIIHLNHLADDALLNFYFRIKQRSQRIIHIEIEATCEGEMNTEIRLQETILRLSVLKSIVTEMEGEMLIETEKSFASSISCTLPFLME